jgi:hypothetical protein
MRGTKLLHSLSIAGIWPANFRMSELRDTSIRLVVKYERKAVILKLREERETYFIFSWKRVPER